MIRLFLPVLWFFVFHSLKGSENDSLSFVYFGLLTHYGFIIPHSQSIRDISHTNPFGVELSRNKLHTSQGKWQVFNSYWISGLELRYFNYQNPDILGGVFDFSVYAEPVVDFGKKYLFTIRGGAGLSYHTRIYDPVENPRNMFFSSRFNFPLFVDARFKYRFGERTILTLSACYNHISNGGIKQPNKGMNFPTMAIGIERYQKEFPALHKNFLAEAVNRRKMPYFLFQGLTSVKVLEAYDQQPEQAALIYGFQARYVQPLGIFYALNAGFEMIFDGYLKEMIQREQKEVDYKRFALTFGQDFMLSKVVFTQHLGVYLYSPSKARNAVYQKYELAYRINERFMAGVFLKAHLHVAELMGVNLSLIFPWK